MLLSGCVFYTGPKGGSFPDVLAARDALDELFTHSDLIPPGFLKELKALGIVLPAPPIRVISVSPGPGKVDFSMRHAREFAGKSYSALANELPAPGIFYYTNSQIHGVIHCDGAAEVEAVYRFLHKWIGSFPAEERPHAAISREFPQLNQISLGCEENREAHRFERFLSAPIDVLVQPADFFLYDSAGATEETDAFFAFITQKICNAVALQDAERAHEAMDDALQFIITKYPRVSAIHIHALHFCQPLELNLIGANLVDRLYVQQHQWVQKILNAEDEAALRSVFHDQLDQILHYALERKNKKHAEIIQQAAEYIDQNLTDCLLSISTIAAEFHISENRLSMEFRSYFQESIPDYIHQKRVQRIKQLLRTTEDPIRSIALDTGYVSLATMNRAFLRLEGVTPGQYRKAVNG